MPGTVFTDLAHLTRTRATLAHFHGSVETRIGPVDDPGILVTIRDHPVGLFVGVHNVTPEWRCWPGWRIHELGAAHLVDALTGDALSWHDDGNVWLPPYAVLWLV